MTFKILHNALVTAERAVKIIKQREKNKQEDEMAEALERINISGQVPLDGKVRNSFEHLNVKGTCKLITYFMVCF